MRRGQRARVQNGTGPGIGGRVGQTAHVRAPGGGSLFEHGVILKTSGEGTSSAQRPFDEVLWDTDGYFDADWDPYIVRIPADLAGVYLLLASIPYSGPSDEGAGWWKQWINVSGVSRDLNDVGQWQQGYRAFNVLRSTGAFAQMAAIVVLEEDDWVDLDSEDHLSSAIIEGGGSFSAFRLGAVGEENFHGALTYVSQEFGGGPYPLPYFNRTFGPMLFDTDGYEGTNNRLVVPTGLAGLYVMCASRRFKVTDISYWDPNPPIWPFGFDWAQTPVMLGNTDVPDNDGNAYPAQSQVPGVDINDCSAQSNYVSVTSFWVGRLREADRVEVLSIANVIGNPTTPITTNMNAACTYLALVRIAP